MNANLSATACVDWKERMARGQAPINRARLPINTPEAKRFGAIFDKLRVGDLAGSPKTSELPNFGWLRDAGCALWGGPTIRECLLSCGKKNSKSNGGALLFLAAFLANKTPRQQFTILAPSIGIAEICFGAVTAAIESDPELAQLTHVKGYTRTIEHRRLGSILSVKAIDKSATTGLKGSVLLDESWLLGEKSTATKAMAQVRGAIASNPDAKLLHISTTSDDVPRGTWAELLRYARGVRDGRIDDPAFLPILYEYWRELEPNDFPPEEDWPKLLPSFPHIAGPEYYRSAIASSVENGAAGIALTKAQLFNITPETAMAGAESWSVARVLPKITTPGLSIESIVETCESVAVGVDLGGFDDLTAITAIGVVSDQWHVATRAWATDGVWKGNQSSRTIFDDAVAAGDLFRIEPGDDVPAIIDILRDANSAGKLAVVGMDGAGAADLLDLLEVETGFQIVTDPDQTEGYGTTSVMGISQTARGLHPALKSLERKAEAGRLRISDQPLLAWCLANTRIARVGAADAIDRSRRQDKIDCVAALLTGTAALLIRPKVDEFDVEALVG